MFNSFNSFVLSARSLVARSVMARSLHRVRSLTGANLTVTIVSAVLGTMAFLFVFALLTLYLYRFRQQAILDEESAGIPATPTTSRLRDLKSQALDYGISKPKTPRPAFMAPSPFRASFTLPSFNNPRSAPRPMERGSQSPPSPGKSAVWRGKQWVTISRPRQSPAPATSRALGSAKWPQSSKASPWGGPKTSLPKPGRPMTPLSSTDTEKGWAGVDEDKRYSRVQRLSMLITNMKQNWSEVQL